MGFELFLCFTAQVTRVYSPLKKFINRFERFKTSFFNAAGNESVFGYSILRVRKNGIVLKFITEKKIRSIFWLIFKTKNDITLVTVLQFRQFQENNFTAFIEILDRVALYPNALSFCFFFSLNSHSMILNFRLKINKRHMQGIFKH